MKVRNNKLTYCILLTVAVAMTCVFYACAPVWEFMTWKRFEGHSTFMDQRPAINSTKKTVILVADNEGTEIFDLMAPYYLFSATGKLNVYVVAPQKAPIIMRKGVFLLPHFSFSEFDATGLHADVIVIPNLSAMDARHQNPAIINWIKSHYKDTAIMLSVCDGALTAAATGIYDGKPLTAHASDFAAISKQYSKPMWISNVRVTHSYGLYSTAGVSNATDGALAVIDTLLGHETMLQVSKSIHYTPPPETVIHKSIPISFGDKIAIGKKVLLGKNRKIGVLLQDGVNELELAAVLDTYNRTFPKSLESVTLANNSITTAYGLTLLPTANLDKFHPDELHVLKPDHLPLLADSLGVVRYEQKQPLYIIDACLIRIQRQYGSRYTEVVKRLLDYN